jgi:uncharacterized protein
MTDLPSPIENAQKRLEATLTEIENVAVALSGGVDSTTLAHHAQQALGSAALMIHAISPAVPHEATERVRHIATEKGWNLKVIDAGEFSDPRYLANPIDRCFFCKTNLYGAMAEHTDAQLLSGANLDDLKDFRPGLTAAQEYGVRHPLIEAEIDKATVRLLAKQAGLEEVAELDSAPCLSSRIQTGIYVTAERLGLIDEVERRLRAKFGTGTTIRCRILPHTVEIQLDDNSLNRAQPQWEELAAEIATIGSRYGVDQPILLAPYRRGSAFSRKPAHVT